jgi:hypothetical protein
MEIGVMDETFFAFYIALCMLRIARFDAVVIIVERKDKIIAYRKGPIEIGEQVVMVKGNFEIAEMRFQLFNNESGNIGGCRGEDAMLLRIYRLIGIPDTPF